MFTTAVAHLAHLAFLRPILRLALRRLVVEKVSREALGGHDGGGLAASIGCDRPSSRDGDIVGHSYER